MAKFSFNMTDAAIADGIAQINKTATKTRDQVHMVACSIIRNWVTSGDAATAARRASELTNGIDPSHAQKAVNWFGTYCKFEWNKETKAYAYTKTTASAEVFQAAKAETMFALTGDAEPKAFDFRGAILKAVDKAVRHTAKPVEGDDVPADLVAAIRLVASSPEHMARVLAA